MNVPSPPFRSVTEELLYNIYLKMSGGNSSNGIRPEDISTLEKLNAFLTDAVLAKTDDITSAIDALKGNVPSVADTLEKLYNLIRGLNFLKREDIDQLAELNAIIQDTDLVRSEDLTIAVKSIQGNVSANGNTLEKLYDLITKAEFVTIQRLTEVLNSYSLKRRVIQFYFNGDNWGDDHQHNNDRNKCLMKGKIGTLSQDLTSLLSAVCYQTRLDTSTTWVTHNNLSALQTWINTNATGDEASGTKYWLKCLPTYKSEPDGEAVCLFTYSY